MPLDRVPELASLRLLVDVVHLGSIGAAARAAGVSQQAASDRLRSMESQVGVPLVRRSHRGSAPTEAGALLVGWAARLLDVAEEVGEGIATLRADRAARLRVAASMTIAEHLLPRWLLAQRQRALARSAAVPTVELTATNSAHVLEALHRESADLGFVEGAEVPVGVRSREVAVDELVLVVAPGHPWTRRRRPLSAAELAGTALLSRERGSGTREVLELAVSRAGRTLTAPAVELTTATSVREAVRAGSGAAVLSRLAVADDVESGRLAVVPLEGLDLHRVLRAVWTGPPRLPAGAARDLLDVATAGRPRPA